jgi:B12-binding domain/radical SAM domain protein
MSEPSLVAYSVRSGITALNCVAGAAPDRVPVRFVKTREELVRAVAEARRVGQMPVVAWSFYSVDADAAAADLALVRPLTQGALHIAGGVHATAEPRATLEAGFDLVAIGEGEATTRGLFDALARGEDPRLLRGIAHFDDAGRFLSHGPGERRPLDAFPSFRHGRWQPIEITRGCIYACAFCQTPYMFKARFRHRSIDSVRRHVETMAREGSRFVRFLTPTALSYGSDDDGVRLDAIEELLRTTREAAGRSARIYFGTFPSEVRPEHVTPEAVAMLRRWVDNDTIVIGAQSGSERVLEAMRRGHGVAEVERAVRLAVQAGSGRRSTCCSVFLARCARIGRPRCSSRSASSPWERAFIRTRCSPSPEPRCATVCPSGSRTRWRRAWLAWRRKGRRGGLGGAN